VPTANRPRVFVSSTISDFKDLRSALKFWLEELGCEARLSEFNDFQRPPDDTTFDSCFNSIRECHFYILLVGTRKGSPYKDNVSVTQQEYRVAVERAKQGFLTPVIFIRENVMTALKELRAAKAAGGPSTSATLEDPEFIDSFVAEIESTELARHGATESSGTIWHYRFSSFREIVDALRVALQLHGSVTRGALLTNLNWELAENLTLLCQKRGRLPLLHTAWIETLRGQLPLQADDLLRSIRLNSEQASRVAQFWTLSLPDGSRLRTSALQQAILSGEFLQFNQDTKRLEPEPLYVGMQRLLSSVEDYRRGRASLPVPYPPPELWQAARGEIPGAEVQGHVLVFLFQLHDRMKDIVRISAAIMHWIADPDAPFIVPDLTPVTPLADQVAGVEAQLATRDDVQRWIENGALRRFFTGVDAGPPGDVLAGLQEYPELIEIAKPVTDLLLKGLEYRTHTEGPDAALSWFSSAPTEFSARARAQGSDAAMDWLRSEAEPPVY
jgi:hypothetical protein